MKPETVKFTKEVPIADADGKAILEGSVLREISDRKERGVVVRIVRAGDRGTVMDAVGDLNIFMGAGTVRVTNRYSAWQHIPHDEQTHAERLISWNKQAHYYDEESQVSKDESLACSAIMALLPSNTVDDYGPFGDRLDDALGYLARYLDKIKSAK